VFSREPTCTVQGCERPSDGVVTIATTEGSLRLSTCERHGHRVSEGEWLIFRILESNCLLGTSSDRAVPPPFYEPHRVTQAEV
jgi:hypothetical protein